MINTGLSVTTGLYPVFTGSKTKTNEFSEEPFSSEDSVQKVSTGKRNEGSGNKKRKQLKNTYPVSFSSNSHIDKFTRKCKKQILSSVYIENEDVKITGLDILEQIYELIKNKPPGRFNVFKSEKINLKELKSKFVFLDYDQHLDFERALNMLKEGGYIKIEESFFNCTNYTVTITDSGKLAVLHSKNSN